MEGVVNEGRVEDVVFGFIGEFVFPVLSGSFMDAKGAFEVGVFDAEVPVAEASGRDASDGFEGSVGGVGEVSVGAGGVECAVPEGVDVGVVEGGAGLEVGVAVEGLFKALPGSVAVGVEEGLCLGVGAEVVAEGVPVFDWVPVLFVGSGVDVHSVLSRGNCRLYTEREQE